MRAVLLAFPLIVLAAGAAPVPAAAEERGFRLYVDESFKTQVLVPQSWKEHDAEDWVGRRFRSPDGRGWLAVYGAVQNDEDTAEHMRAVILAAGEDITYLRHGRRWVVVSGFKGERIFYRKAILVCADSVWQHVAFEYPADQKQAYDRLVTLVSASLWMPPQQCVRVRRSDPLVGQAP